MKGNMIKWFSKYHEKVGSSASLLTAITALITVIFSITALTNESRSKRPYFVVDNIKLETDVGHPFFFSLKIRNVGSNPAEHFRYQYWLINQDRLIVQQDSFDVANPIASNIDRSISLFTNSSPKVSYAYLVLLLEYADPIRSGASDTQPFYFEAANIPSVGGYPAAFGEASFQTKQTLKKLVEDKYHVEL